MPEVPQQHLPLWLRLGTGGGLLLILGTAIIPGFLRQAWEDRAAGSEDDPYPPKEPEPPANLFTHPVETPVEAEELRTVLMRRWRSLYGDDLTGPQAAVLAAQSALATDYGAKVWNYNPIGLRAGRFYDGGWAVIREPEWKDGRPRHRWAPVRAYASLDAGVHDWLQQLPSEAVEAVRAGDARAFARALIAAELNGAPPSIYEPELVAAWVKLSGRPPQRIDQAAPALT